MDAVSYGTKPEAFPSGRETFFGPQQRAGRRGKGLNFTPRRPRKFSEIFSCIAPPPGAITAASRNTKRPDVLAKGRPALVFGQCPGPFSKPAASPALPNRHQRPQRDLPKQFPCGFPGQADAA